MSFSLTIFHLLILILLIPRARFCGVIHDGFWPIKYMLVIGIYIAAWFINQKFFVVWGHICRAFSVLFLFVQGYFLMNLAYLWNDYLLDIISGGREGDCYAKFLLIGYSIISTVGSVVWLVYCFIWFWGCRLSNTILIETSIFILWFYVAALLRVCNYTLRDNYTIFVCSMVVPYLVFLCWTSLASLPDVDCNKLANSKSNTAL